MKTGITGVPYSGKTTLFCALTGQEYDSLSHGKGIHVGTVKVPDNRLETLNDMFQPKKMTHATMEYFDIAGKTAGGEKTIEPHVLQTLRNADSLIVVLDAFSDRVNLRSDFDSFMEEFVFNDLVIATGRLERIEKELRSKKSDVLLFEKALLEKCAEVLENGDVLRDKVFKPDEKKILSGFQFLSQKSLVIIPNISEEALSSRTAQEYEKQFNDIKKSVCTAICAEIEMEIAVLEEHDRPEFLESMGIKEPARGRVIRLCYESLGLISFFTAGGKDEVRAWTVRKGTRAPECAGTIHSDMERGFIRAEVITFDDLIASGSLKSARDKGLLRIEGKDYIVKDGDILNIRFSI